MFSVLGLDIGGANLKAAHSDGRARLHPFELWKNPAGLAVALSDLVAAFPAWDRLAVTMTGELCDCYDTRRQGVLAILDAVAALPGNRPVRVWQNDGRFVGLEEARAMPLSVAAANWLALATFAGRFCPTGPGLVIDIGSTTTDLVPLRDGRPHPQARTDLDRLRCQELIYTGVRRTPVCALVETAAAEWFATTLDVYLVLGKSAEEVADRSTADGRPATRSAARSRLAHMLCADAETCSEEDLRELAWQAYRNQVDILQKAVMRVVDRLPGPPETIILSGSGEFLAQEVLSGLPALAAAHLLSLTGPGGNSCPLPDSDKQPRGSLANEPFLGLEVSRAACAYALAVLAAEESHEGT